MDTGAPPGARAAFGTWCVEVPGPTLHLPCLGTLHSRHAALWLILQPGAEPGLPPWAFETPALPAQAEALRQSGVGNGGESTGEGSRRGARGEQKGKNTPRCPSHRVPSSSSRKKHLFPVDELQPLHLLLSASIYFKFNLHHLFIHPAEKYVFLQPRGGGSSPGEGSRVGWGSFTTRLMIQLSQQSAPVM